MGDLSLIQQIAVIAIPLLFAITCHEVAHGWVANRLGDPTAFLMGRLTLNPFKHIDLVGTLIVPLVLLYFSNFVFGWAKPVPVNPSNFSKPRRDTALVAVAGPLSNLLMAIFWGGVAKIGAHFLAMQNGWMGEPLYRMGAAGIGINCILGVLNLLPLPPLDGSKIVYSILPGKWVWLLQRYEFAGFFLLLFLYITGLFAYLMTPAFALAQWMGSLFGLN